MHQLRDSCGRVNPPLSTPNADSWEHGPDYLAYCELTASLLSYWTTDWNYEKKSTYKEGLEKAVGKRKGN